MCVEDFHDDLGCSGLTKSFCRMRTFMRYQQLSLFGYSRLGVTNYNKSWLPVEGTKPKHDKICKTSKQVIHKTIPLCVSLIVNYLLFDFCLYNLMLFLIQVYKNIH